MTVWDDFSTGWLMINSRNLKYLTIEWCQLIKNPKVIEKIYHFLTKIYMQNKRKRRFISLKHVNIEGIVLNEVSRECFDFWFSGNVKYNSENASLLCYF